MNNSMKKMIDNVFSKIEAVISWGFSQMSHR